MRTVAIFRRELRLYDNPLLKDAERGEFIPVFFFDDYNQEEHGDNLRTLFFHALRQFKQGIELRGGKFYIVHLREMERFFAAAKPDRVLFCEDVEPHSRQRDAEMVNLLRKMGIRYQSLRDSLFTYVPTSIYPSLPSFTKNTFFLT